MLGSSPLISAVLKISIWGCGRIEEITELLWNWISDDAVISVPDDIAKWGQGRQFRIPIQLLRELKTYRSKSQFVWDSTVAQLRSYHLNRGGKGSATQLGEFTSARLRGRFQKWMQAWAKDSGLTDISHHSFRKTALQWSREEQLRRSENAFVELSSVGLDIAKKHYTTDPSRLRAKILFRNISRELEKDAQLAISMELRNETPSASISRCAVSTC